MSLIVLDTDVFSYVFKADSRAEPFVSLLAGKTACLSFMTVAELYQWALARNLGTSRRQALQRSIDRCAVLPFDNATAHAWAVISAGRMKAGRPIECGDCWVAACALRHNLP